MESIPIEPVWGEPAGIIKLSPGTTEQINCPA
jgi:hypothetical protein